MIPRFKPWIGRPELAVLFSRNNNAVQLFEKKFKEEFNAVDAVAFPYGRSAQWAFLKSIGLENVEIIMPAYTCSVVAHAVTLSGNTPCFIDIKLDDYNMNLDLIQKAITPKTRAIIATHTFGYPQNLDRLELIVRKSEKKYGHKIWLIQDCCHAFGAYWKGRLIGTSGDVAVYAFNISKIMTSIFGGILTFKDQSLADKVRKWRDNNFTVPVYLKQLKRRLYLLAVFAAFNKNFYELTYLLQEKTKLLNKYTKKYHLDEKIHFPPDYLDRMLNIEAAVGLVQLKKYKENIKRRINNAIWYDSHLRYFEGIEIPPVIDGATFSHYVIRVKNRKKILHQMANHGVHLGELIQYSIPELKPYKHLNSCFENSLIASKTTVNLPVHPGLCKKDLRRITKTLKISLN